VKARCLVNDVEALPSYVRETRRVPGRGLMSITPGREYLIFAVLIDPDSAWLEWFYIIDDLELSFPTWYPSCAFEITDASLPSIWVYGSEWLPNPTRPGHPRQLLLANREWVEDPEFYELLTNEEDRALSIFCEVRRKIEEESL
jgi:hypothetical protein